MQYVVTYQPDSNRPAETIEADRHSLEAHGANLVFRGIRRVGFQEREVVIRRLDARIVLTVEPAP